MLENPTITSAIVGASKPEQLDQTLPAVDLKLDEQLREACNAIWYQLPHESNSEIAYRTHLAFYAGWPRAMSAITVAKRVFSEE